MFDNISYAEPRRWGTRTRDKACQHRNTETTTVAKFDVHKTIVDANPNEAVEEVVVVVRKRHGSPPQLSVKS